MQIYISSVRLWSSRPASEGRGLQLESAGEVPGVPQPPRTLCRSQRHVRPHGREAAGHWGEVLRQRGLLQTLPAGQFAVCRALSIRKKESPESKTLSVHCYTANIFNCVSYLRIMSLGNSRTHCCFSLWRPFVWLRIIRCWSQLHLEENLTSSHGWITQYETWSGCEKQLVARIKRGGTNRCLFFRKCTAVHDLSDVVVLHTLET